MSVRHCRDRDKDLADIGRNSCDLVCEHFGYRLQTHNIKQQEKPRYRKLHQHTARMYSTVRMRSTRLITDASDAHDFCQLSAHLRSTQCTP
jgi:hypothetical protein